jgi:hypothetical protein
MTNEPKNIYPTIVFPNEESKGKYVEEMEKLGFHEIETGPTINIEEVKRRIFVIKDE